MSEIRRWIPPVIIAGVVGVTAAVAGPFLARSRKPVVLPTPVATSSARPSLDTPKSKKPRAQVTWKAPSEYYSFLPGERPQIQVVGKVGAKVTVTARPVEIEKWLTGQYSLQNVKPVATVSVTLPTPKPGDRRPVAEIDKDGEPRRVGSGKRITSGDYYTGASIGVRFPALPPGAYVVSTQGGKLYNDAKDVLLVITRIAVTVQSTPSESLVRVVRLDTGEAIPEASLTFMNNETASAPTTNADGIYAVKNRDSLHILARLKDNLAFTYGYEPGDIPESDPNAQIIFFQTDRPLYRPGQKVGFRGVLRQRVDDGYKVIPNTKMTIAVSTPDGEDLEPISVTTNEFGSFSGEIPLATDAPLGAYQVSLSSAGSSSREGETFTVAKFRKPEYYTQIKAGQAVTVQGETFTAEISANYYFGAPVAGATATYSIVAQPDWWWWRAYDTEAKAADADFPGVSEDDTPHFRDSYYRRRRDDSDYYGQPVANGTVHLDAQGKARISVPAKFFADQGRGYFGSRILTRMRYIVRCNVMDQSRQTVAATGGGAVVPSGVALTASQDRWGVSVGESVAVKLKTLNAKTATPVTKPVSVRLTRRVLVRRKVTTASPGRPVGSFYWHEDVIPLETRTVTTNEKGEGTFTFTPMKAGSYSLEATAKDTDGKSVTALASAWVYDKDDGFSGNEAQITLSPDKKRYYPGDTATILLQTPAPDADVWVTTVSLQGTQSQRVRVTKNSAVVKVPLLAGSVPNVTVSASYVRNKKMVVAETTLLISPRNSLLRVSVAPGKKEYQPGETASYTVKTLDQDGKPVSAEVGFSLSDESLFALVSDNVEDIREAFWSPVHLFAQLTFSYSELPIGNANGELLNAYGNGPGAMGGAGGGVARGGAGFARYAGSAARPMEVASAAGKVANGRADKDDANGFSAPTSVRIRSDFRDSAYWSPSVVTDGSGTATIEVPLPDNLTEWRATARAVTSKTQVGWATTGTSTSLPLIARLAAPRFATQGDALILSGVIHNYTPETLTTKVTLSAQGPGVALEGGGAIRTVTIKPGEEQRIDWQARGAQPGLTQLTLVADAGTVKDGMTLPFPTLPFGAYSTVASSGVLPANGIVKGFALPAGRVSMRDDLKVIIAPSLLSLALGGAEDIAAYPYGCIEQTLSKFIPNLVLEKLLKERNAEHPKKANLPDMAKTGLGRVYALQLEDGGWGFGFTSDPYFTALAVEGLLLAKECGYSVKQPVLDRGIAALRTSTEKIRLKINPKAKNKDEEKWEVRWNLQRKARALYVLSLVQPEQTKESVRSFWARRSELETTSIALLTRAAVKLGLKDIVGEGIALLHKRVQSGSVGVWWKMEQTYYIERDTLATAEAIRALIAADKSDPLIKNAFRYLVAQRQERRWYTTNDTAAVLYAVADYEHAFPPRPDSLTGANVIVNGKTIKTLRFSDRELLKPEVTVELDPDMLQAGTNEVSVTPLDQGDAPVYYSIALRYFMPRPAGTTIEPVTAGLRVERTYLKRVPKAPLKPGQSPDYYWSDGNWSLVPFNNEAKPGDEIMVKLVVSSDSPVGYAVIEDFLPAGCEPADQIDADGSDSGYGYRYGWWGGWGRRETHDERIAFLGERLERGQTVLTYRLRVVTPGAFNATPARAFAMYVPEIRGSAKSARITVKE